MAKKHKWQPSTVEKVTKAAPEGAAHSRASSERKVSTLAEATKSFHRTKSASDRYAPKRAVRG